LESYETAVLIVSGDYVVSRIPLTVLNWDAEYGLYCYEGTPFTGVAYTVGSNGVLEAEAEYQDGLRFGKYRQWHRDGTLAAEGDFRAGVIHGCYKEWHSNGRIALEHVCEYGVTLSEKKWDENGVLLKAYAIAQGGRDWQRLLRYRELFTK
jgi:antitoxin component YwqK of YwqJK toxin-antitoxin module